MPKLTLGQLSYRCEQAEKRYTTLVVTYSRLWHAQDAYDAEKRMNRAKRRWLRLQAEVEALKAKE